MHSITANSSVVTPPSRSHMPTAWNTRRSLTPRLCIASLIAALAGCSSSGMDSLLDSLLKSAGLPGLAPLVTVTEMTPQTGLTEGGTEVTLRGSGFADGVGVLFGDQSAAAVTVVNEGLILATTPARDAGQVELVMIDIYGDSVATGFNFTYVAPEAPARPVPPTVTSIAPDTGPVAGGTEVTIRGAAFQEKVGVLFGDQAALNVQYVNDGLILATTPPHEAGQVPLVLTDIEGLEAATQFSFTYTAPVEPQLPTITSVTPNSGPINGGTEVVIEGQGFSSFGTGVQVLFGATTTPSVTVVSDTRIQVVSPAHDAGVVDIAIIDDNQQNASLAGAFTFVALELTITSVTPDTGPVAGGTEIVIQGVGFSSFGSGLKVLFGATAAPSVSVTSDTEIRTATPPHDAGATDVVVADDTQRSVSLTGAFTFTTAELTVASISPTEGTTEGGTQVTIQGTGFMPGTVVLFDALAATEVTIGNENVLTALTPAHAEGAVSVVVKTADGRQAQVTQQFTYRLTDPNAIDTDGDGLTDVQEAAGWEVLVDELGLGTEYAVRRAVVSDLNKTDTDADGLSDAEEYANRSDPTRADTDGDGLTDADEVKRWLTSPVSVDSDGDARGPARDMPPRPELFDKAELALDADGVARGTSPTLADTDGDGRSDFEEFDHPSRSPLIADMPALELKVTDDIDIRLDVEYAEEQGTSTEYTSTVTRGTETEQSWNTGGTLQVTAGVSHEVSWKAEVGFPKWATQAAHKTTLSLQVAYSQAWQVAGRNAESFQEEASKMESKSLTHTETASSGSMSTGIILTNSGPVSYHLTDLGMTVRLWQREANTGDPSHAGTFKTLATLTPALGNGFTLAPGESTPVIQVQAENVNADRIKDFMKDPHALHLEQAYYALQTEDGLNYAFIEETTQSRTAAIMVDFGDGEWHKYRFATNVHRDDSGRFAGVRLADALNLLGVEFRTEMQNDVTDPANPVPIRRALVQVRKEDGAWLPADASQNSEHTLWAVFGSSEDFADTDKSFEDITLKAGQAAMLVFAQDTDEDGLYKWEEQQYGTSDDTSPTSADSDGDGITDFAEVSPARLDDTACAEPPCFQPAGWDVSVTGKATYHVFSDPRAADADADGWNDLQERTAGTDPNKKDTDGDMIPDNEDVAPLVPAARMYVKPDGPGPDGLTWDRALSDLRRAIDYAAFNNLDDDLSNNISEIWVAAGTYTISSTRILLPKVGIYGGFVGTETKREQRNSDAFSNGTEIMAQNRRAFSSFNTNLIGTVVDGLTISNCSAASDTDGNGGAIFINAGDHTVDLTFRNVRFVANSAYWGGGAVAAYGASKSNVKLTFESCVFAQNSVSNYDTAVGGAIRTEPATLILRDCQFVDNAAGFEGGAMYCRNSDVTAERCTFLTNTARNGGAIRSRDAILRIQACDFDRNLSKNNNLTQQAAGGAIISAGGSLSARNCRFAQNRTEHTVPLWQGWGGAIYFENATDLSLTNCVFWGNVAADFFNKSNGGALFIKALGTALITNCTFAGNSGGETVLEFVDTPLLTLQNTIIAHNAVSANDFQLRSITGTGLGLACQLSHCCLDPNEGESSPTVVKADPKFVSDWNTTGIPALDEGSPLIDFGNNYPDTEAATPGVQYLPEIDANGNPRFTDGNGDGKAVVDIGACEYQGASAP